MPKSCPKCRAAVPDTSRDRPFCSERCRMLDLSAWLTEGYAIPGPADPSVDDWSDPEDETGSRSPSSQR